MTLGIRSVDIFVCCIFDAPAREAPEIQLEIGCLNMVFGNANEIIENRNRGGPLRCWGSIIREAHIGSKPEPAGRNFYNMFVMFN